jgi:hypothetical protein
MSVTVDPLLGFNGTAQSLGPDEGDRYATDIYFSADVETDGPIPGPYSMLSFGLVLAGSFDGKRFLRPENYETNFYCELKPISDQFEIEALQINGLDRDHLLREGEYPHDAMARASEWIYSHCGTGRPILVAYPLSFDWAFLYWYFVRFSQKGSPFNYSHCFDIKTAYAVKANLPIASSGRSHLAPGLRPESAHTHNALEDAIEQAQVFANLFEWRSPYGKRNQRETDTLE